MNSARFFARACACAIAIAACGDGSSDDGPKILTSRQDLCAGAPPDYGDHVVTMISCPWEQHTNNIVKFGKHEAQARVLRDATGTQVATVTDTCETWTMGKDADGTTVIIRGDTGAVASHGNTHPGQSVSRLPATLALPLSLE